MQVRLKYEIDCRIVRDPVDILQDQDSDFNISVEKIVRI